MLLYIDNNDLTRLGLGESLIRALSWRGGEINSESILASNRETKDILIKESDLMKLIQRVNPLQDDRRIRLI